MKIISKYLGIFILWFVALTALSFTQPVKKSINEFYGATHTGIFKTMLPELEMTYHSWKKTGDTNEFYYQVYGKKEMERLIAEAKAKGLRSVKQSSLDVKFYLNVFFTPFLIFLLSLILATPLPIKNKLIALSVGLILFLLYQILRVYVKILKNVNAEQMNVYDLEGTSESMVEFFAGIFQAGFTAGIVALIWALVVFNKKNLGYLKKQFGLE